MSLDFAILGFLNYHPYTGYDLKKIFDSSIRHFWPAGRAELLRWLFASPPLGEPRSAPLVQVFFAGQLSDEEILAKFEGFAALLRAILGQYDQIPARIELYQQEITSRREHFFWMLTLDNGIRTMRASLEWAENVIEQIRSGRIPSK